MMFWLAEDWKPTRGYVGNPYLGTLYMPVPRKTDRQGQVGFVRERWTRNGT